MQATLSKEARRHLPILRVLGDGTTVPAVALDRAVCVVGRGRWANLPLNQPQVSKVHALIVRGKGRVVLRDLASTNGVKRNGEPVQESTLTNEDVIRIGGYTLGCESGFGADMNGDGASEVADAPAAQLRSGDAKFPLPTGRHTFLIGQRKACEVRLEHPSVAPVHGVIFEIDGKRYVQDFGSTGGTHLNGRKIHREELSIGDEISIGDVRLTYEAAIEDDEQVVEEIEMEEVAPAEMPLAMAEAPAEMELAVADASDAPVDIEAALVDIDDALVNMDDAPVDMEEALVDMEDAPVKRERAPTPVEAATDELPDEVMLDPVENVDRRNVSLDEIMQSDLPLADDDEEEVLLEPMAGVDRDASTLEEIAERDRPREDDLAVAPTDALQHIELEPVAMIDRDNATLEEIAVADLPSKAGELSSTSPGGPQPVDIVEEEERDEIPLEPIAGVDRDNATLEEIAVDDLPREEEISIAPTLQREEVSLGPVPARDEQSAKEVEAAAAAEAFMTESVVEKIAPEPIVEETEPEPVVEQIAPQPAREQPRAHAAPPRAEELHFDQPADEELDLAAMENVDWDAEVPPEIEAPKIEEPPEDASIVEFITTLVDEVHEKSTTLKAAWTDYQMGGKKNRPE